MKCLAAWLCLCLSAGSAGQLASGPGLTARDIVNAADYRGGGVAPGEIVVLFPSNAGPPEMAPWGLDANLRTTFSIGETRVLFDNVAAPLFYSMRGQVGAVVPTEIARKKTTEVVVEYQGQRSPPVNLDVVDSAPAVFTLDASGKGQAAMLNDTGCCNSVRNPAARGKAATLYATGEGRIARNVSVTVGGVRAHIAYTNKGSPLQVNFDVPANAPVGDAVPLVLTVGNRHSSPEVTMAIRSARQSVLVLEQDAAIRYRLAHMLRGAGYDVLTAEKGPEPDLVIADLALIRNVRPRLKLIAIAPALSPDALREADLLGAQAVLTKPLTTEKVLPRVRKLLERRPAVY